MNRREAVPVFATGRGSVLLRHFRVGVSRSFARSLVRIGGLVEFDGRIAEDPSEYGGDTGRVRLQVLLEYLKVFAAHSGGNKASPQRVSGKQVRLQAVFHLQDVFEVPQEFVSVEQSSQFSLGQELPVGQAHQADQACAVREATCRGRRKRAAKPVR